MKREKIYLSLIFIMIILVGCNNQESYKNNKSPKKKTSQVNNIANDKKEEVKKEKVEKETVEKKEKEKLLNSGLVLGLKKISDNINEPFQYETIWIGQKEDDIEVYRKSGTIIAPFITGLKKIEPKVFKKEKLAEWVTEKKEYYYNYDYDHKIEIKSLVQSDLKKGIDTSEISQNKLEEVLKKIKEPREEGVIPFNIRTINEEIMFVGNKEILIKTVELLEGGGNIRSRYYSTNLYKLEELNSIHRKDNSNNYISKISKQDMDTLKSEVKSEMKNGFTAKKTEIDTENLFMNRKEGKWIFSLASKGFYESRGGSSFGESEGKLNEVSLKVPSELTCSDDLTIPFEEIKKKIPNVVDAVSSPNGGMIVVLTDNEIKVYTSNIEDLTTPDKVIPIEKGQTIILNQWALGKYVDIWTKEIKEYKDLTIEKAKEIIWKLEFTKGEYENEKSGLLGKIGPIYYRYCNWNGFNTIDQLEEVLGSYCTRDALTYLVHKDVCAVFNNKIGYIGTNEMLSFIDKDNSMVRIIRDEKEIKEVEVEIFLEGDYTQNYPQRWSNTVVYTFELMDNGWKVTNIKGYDRADNKYRAERVTYIGDWNKINASSVLSENKFDYNPYLIDDSESNTAWIEGVKGDGIGEWIAFESEQEVEVTGMEILNGYFKNREVYEKNNRVKKIKVEFSDGSSDIYELEDLGYDEGYYSWPIRYQFQRIDFGKKIKTKKIKVSILEVFRGTKYRDTCLSEIKFIEAKQ